MTTTSSAPPTTATTDDQALKAKHAAIWASGAIPPSPTRSSGRSAPSSSRPSTSNPGSASSTWRPAPGPRPCRPRAAEPR